MLVVARRSRSGAGGPAILPADQAYGEIPDAKGFRGSGDKAPEDSRSSNISGGRSRRVLCHKK